MSSFQVNAVRIFLSAGEASGDLHGSNLVRAIKMCNPAATITCLGGELLRRAGADVLVDNHNLAVVGLFEVARHAKVIYQSWHKIRSHFLETPPDVTILIDFPDFNLLLARLAKKVGSRVFYYISPQVWAWRTGRVRTIKRLVDDMAVILPFEAEFYERFGIKTTFVGHPLLDVLSDAPSREQASARYRQSGTDFLVGLLPGSRASEIRSLLNVLLHSARLLRRRFPGISFILPVASTLDGSQVEREAKKWNLPLQIVLGDTYGAIRASDLLITASGTVTLESAILGTPMIIVYKVSRLTYASGRWLIKVHYAGLPNIIMGKSVVPELLQEEARPDRIAEEAAALLKHPERLERQRQELKKINNRLGTPGVSHRVARLVLGEP